jgi:AraC-like DNA-binding protein
MGNSMLTELLALPLQAKTVAFPRGRLALHAMPASAGIEAAESPGYSWNGLRRGLTPFAVIQHTLRGSGMLAYEGRTLPLEAGETMLVTIPHDHRYFVPPGGSWSFFYLVLTGQEALRLCSEVVAAAGPVLNLSPQALDRLAGSVVALLAGAADTPGEASTLAYRAAMALIDGVSGVTPAAGACAQPSWLMRVTTHIDGHLGDTLTIDELAGIAGLSRAHFVRQFARFVGSPPSEYVFRTRMARAARLLQATRLPVQHIAAALGFAEPNYFAKAFRRAFAVSPTEFKQSGLFTAPEAPQPFAEG